MSCVDAKPISGLLSSFVACAVAIAPTSAWAGPAETEPAASESPAEAETPKPESPESPEAESPVPEDAEEVSAPTTPTTTVEDEESGIVTPSSPQSETEQAEELAGGEESGADNLLGGTDTREEVEPSPLAGPIAEQPAPVPPAPQVADPPTTDTMPEPKMGGRTVKGTGLLIAGGSTLALGVGLTVGFGLMTRNCSFDGPLSCRYRNQDKFLIPLGATVTLAGAVLLGVGVGYRLRYNRWERQSGGKQAVVTPTLLPGGGGLGYAARF